MWHICNYVAHPRGTSYVAHPCGKTHVAHLMLRIPCGTSHVVRCMLQVAAARESLDANLEELFDVVACYFPISFSPPPNNVHGITRQDLADALEGTLTCTPLFAPLFIPMLVEKLSSTLRYS